MPGRIGTLMSKICTRPSLTRRGPLRSLVERTPERTDEVLERPWPLLSREERRRADDDAVGELGGGTGLLGRRDAEAGEKRHVRDGPRPLDETGELGRK